MLGLSLPDSISPDDVRTTALVVAVLAVVLLLLVLRFVQKLMMKLTATVVLGLVVLGAFYYRGELADCAKTCECRVLGIDVKIPKGDLPPNAGVVCADKAS